MPPRGLLDVLGLHEMRQVFQDYVHDVLMEVSVLAEAEEIELERPGLDHAHIRDVVDVDAAEVRLSCLGAKRRELRALERDHVVTVLVLVHEGLEKHGVIVMGILHAFVAQKGDAFKLFRTSSSSAMLSISFGCWFKTWLTRAQRRPVSERRQVLRDAGIADQGFWTGGNEYAASSTGLHLSDLLRYSFGVQPAKSRKRL